MKKSITAIAITASIIAFSSCSQQNTERDSDSKIAMSIDLGRENFNAGLAIATRNSTDKANLAQADYNAN